MSDDMSWTRTAAADAAAGSRIRPGVQKNILAVAMAEFAANGLSGARIDEIAAKTHTSKRMIYYYFGDKERLYGRVLEEAYRQVRTGEQELELDHLPPVEALRRLAEFTFDHHSRHPDFIRIVMIENIHHGVYLEQSELIRLLNAGAIQKLEAICRRGRAAGLFREDVSPTRIALAHQRVELLQRLQPRHLLAHFRRRALHRRRAALAPGSSGGNGCRPCAQTRAPEGARSCGNAILTEREPTSIDCAKQTLTKHPFIPCPAPDMRSI